MNSGQLTSPSLISGKPNNKRANSSDSTESQPPSKYLKITSASPPLTVHCSRSERKRSLSVDERKACSLIHINKLTRTILQMQNECVNNKVVETEIPKWINSLTFCTLVIEGLLSKKQIDSAETYNSQKSLSLDKQISQLYNLIQDLLNQVIYNDQTPDYMLDKCILVVQQLCLNLNATTGFVDDGVDEYKHTDSIFTRWLNEVDIYNKFCRINNTASPEKVQQLLCLQSDFHLQSNVEIQCRGNSSGNNYYEHVKSFLNLDLSDVSKLREQILDLAMPGFREQLLFRYIPFKCTDLSFIFKFKNKLNEYTSVDIRVQLLFVPSGTLGLYTYNESCKLQITIS